MATFPELEPNTRSYDFGLFPLTEEPSLSAGIVRFRHSTSPQNYQLTLGYNAITDAQATLIRNHYQGQGGGYRSFLLPAVIWQGHTSNDNIVPAETLWRYSETPEEEHLAVGRINVTIALVSDGVIPPIEAPGFTGGVTASITAGAATAITQAPGFTGNVTVSVTGGTATGGGVTLPNIGDAYEGGFYAGLISHTADGVATHALIVAPGDTGATGGGYTLTTPLSWKTTSTTTAGTTNTFDGAVNTAAMVTAGIANHPAANFCKNLNIGGYTDWYLPSYYELDIAYQNLKPTTAQNNSSTGVNPYSVPTRSVNRTLTVPTQTSVVAFQSGGAQAFIGFNHFSSTEVSAGNGRAVSFSDGSTGTTLKTSTQRVRALRKVAL